jgi:hypothetical protein
MSLADLRTTEALEVQYNPTEIQEDLSVNYTELDVLGLSHLPLQYKNTSNAGFSFDFELFIHRNAGLLYEPTFDVPGSRNFLRSLCYPPPGAQDVSGGAPPDVLFVWPNFASLICKLRGLKMKHVMFALDGTIIHTICSVTLTEVRDFRLTSDDVRKGGMQRSGKT